MMIAQDIRRLWRHIRERRRKQLIFLLMLMVLTAFAEVLSIGAVLPFLGVLVDPGRIFNNPTIKPFLEFLELQSPNELVMPLALSFGAAAIIAGMMRLLLLKMSNRLVFAIGGELSVSIYQQTLFQPYSVHILRNSSEVISGNISKISNVIYGIILPLTTFLSSCIILIICALTLLTINPFALALVVSGFGIIYGVLISRVRRHVKASGDTIAHQSTQVLKVMQEGLGGIRDILIDGSQKTFCEIYSQADSALRNAQESVQYIANSPRYLIEALGMMLIAGIAYFFTVQADDKMVAIPVLGALALGAQRLLPLLQQSYASWSVLQGTHSSLRDVLILLDQPISEFTCHSQVEPMAFRNTLSLRNVSFRYSNDSPWVLRDITVDIPWGSRVGLIGATGCGKSTLLDILMGLLEPTDGAVIIDGTPINRRNIRGWQSHIAHVPQNIFLSDAS